MGSERERLSREREAERLLRFLGQDAGALYAVLERQVRTINSRAQLVLGVCSMLISASVVVTAGHIIGRLDFKYERIAALLLTGAGVISILAATLVCVGILTMRWTTQQPGEDLRAWLLSNLEQRDTKTRPYQVSVVLVLAALLMYQLALGIVLFQI